jgi:hypothetical protein
MGCEEPLECDPVSMGEGLVLASISEAWASACGSIPMVLKRPLRVFDLSGSEADDLLIAAAKCRRKLFTISTFCSVLIGVSFR